MLNDYKIRNKLRYIISNNVFFNNTFIKYLADTLYKEDVFYDVKQRRLRCNDHIINLIMQIFLFEKTMNDYEYSENMTDSSSDAQLN